MATFNLSKKLSHRPQANKPQVERVNQTWATTKPVKQQQAVKTVKKASKKGWSNGEGWSTSSSRWAQKTLKQQAVAERVAKHNAEQHRPTRLSSVHGLQELQPDGTWLTVRRGREVGHRKYEGYSFKTHHVQNEVIPEDKPYDGPVVDDTAPKLQPRKITGKRACGGSVFRPDN